jgi:hypothetical protein
MSLTKVNLTWEALLACTAHALSTEQQEIMGILIGSWQSGTPEQVRVTTLSLTISVVQEVANSSGFIWRLPAFLHDLVAGNGGYSTPCSDDAAY